MYGKKFMISWIWDWNGKSVIIEKKFFLIKSVAEFKKQNYIRTGNL